MSEPEVGLRIGFDKKGQPMVEWLQRSHWKRAWIQRKDDEQKDWAGASRYLNVVRVAEGNPKGNPTDFPVFDDSLSDQQILLSFVTAACAATGCPLPDCNSWEIVPAETKG